MNKELLKYHMAKHGDTAADLASCLGISRVSLSKKMNGNDAEFKQREIQMIAGRYSLDSQEITNIFFTM